MNLSELTDKIYAEGVEKAMPRHNKSLRKRTPRLPASSQRLRKKPLLSSLTQKTSLLTSTRKHAQSLNSTLSRV